MSASTAAFESMATHVVALIGTGTTSSVTDTDALTAINNKLDALLASESSYAGSITAVSATTTTTIVVAAEPTDYRYIVGMDCNTGKLLRGIDFLRQRLADALTTPLGSQCLLRARGSNLQSLVDTPMNPIGLAGWIAAIAAALSSELAGIPDFTVSRVKLATATLSGQLGIDLTGEWLGQSVEITL